jgi:aerobic carbon-monoxide dehydrogenase medium subunit
MNTPFDYHRATSIADARTRHAATDDARYLAGGQTLLPVIKQRLATPTALVALVSLRDLSGITRDGNTITIRAMTRHADVAASGIVRKAIPAIAILAGGIGDPHVRNRGTIGGSIANNDPSADYPASVLGLNATIHTDRRAIPADNFFTGLFSTALETGELITHVSFPVPDAASYAKFPNPASRYAVAGVMVSRTGSAVRVAVTGAGAHVFRVKAMEDALMRNFAPAAIACITVPDADLNADIHASAAYRAHLITVLAKRAVAAALERQSA